jgi:pimeloyl-ACP methyl ester carboxylesterase
MSDLDVQRLLVNGFNTEYIIHGKEKTEEDIMLVIVPGNPGIVEFYIEFMNCLHEMMNYSVLAVSHAGHVSTEFFDNHQQHSLQDQVNHKIEYLQMVLNGDVENVNANRGTKFILLGHSIGSYIALKIKSFMPDSVIGVVNLMPTIRNLYDGLSPHIKIAIQPGIRHMLGYGIKALPNALIDFLVEQGLHSKVHKSVRDMLKGKVNSWVLWNVFYMAYTESQEIINVDPDVQEVIQNYPEEMIFLYSPIDAYTPSRYIVDLIKSAPSTVTVQMTENDQVEHAFVLVHSREVAEQITTILNSKIPQQ